MKRFLLPLLALIALPTAVYAESIWLVVRYATSLSGEDGVAAAIEKIEMRDSSSMQVINTFLTLTYDYNLSVPLSLFKFDINKYENYTIVK